MSGKPKHPARVKPAHIARVPWPFGDSYVSQLAPHYGKQDGRGQHMVGNGKPITVVDTSKYAPKRPKRGSQILLPGSRDQQHGVPTLMGRAKDKP